MKDSIASLDQGTTCSRAIVFDRTGRVVPSAPYIFPGFIRSSVGQNADILLDSAYTHICFGQFFARNEQI